MQKKVCDAKEWPWRELDELSAPVEKKRKRGKKRERKIIMRIPLSSGTCVDDCDAQVPALSLFSFSPCYSVDATNRLLV